jgi:hypothetical protein
MRIIVWLFMIVVWVLVPLVLYSLHLGGEWDRTFTGGVYIESIDSCHRNFWFPKCIPRDYRKEHVSAYNYTGQYVYGQMRKYSHDTEKKSDNFLKTRYTECHFSSTSYFMLNLEQLNFIYFDSYQEFLTKLQELNLSPELKWSRWYWDEEKQRVIENRWDH